MLTSVKEMKMEMVSMGAYSASRYNKETIDDQEIRGNQGIITKCQSEPDIMDTTKE
jgi:hypothetical protein